MSKAFLREDDLHAETTPAPPVQVLPHGSKNYMTAKGVERLRTELRELADQRSALAVAKYDPEVKRQVQKLEQRIRYLQQSLRTAEIVPTPIGVATDTVRFGATVMVRDETGVETLSPGESRRNQSRTRRSQLALPLGAGVTQHARR